jgi:hypothetical protein
LGICLSNNATSFVWFPILRELCRSPAIGPLPFRRRSAR